MATVCNENSMTVDIRLCGNIPRHEMNALFGAPYPATALTSHAGRFSATANGPTLCPIRSDEAIATTATKLSAINMCHAAVDQQSPLAPVLEPPSWAVAARGETRLEVRTSRTLLCMLFIYIIR